MNAQTKTLAHSAIRRTFIGGSDARIIMGTDGDALVRLRREKRGEAEPEDLSGNLIVQLGLVTEDLNRRWYELNTGQTIKDVQRRVSHPVVRWMSTTLDGLVEGSGAAPALPPRPSIRHLVCDRRIAHRPSSRARKQDR